MVGDESSARSCGVLRLWRRLSLGRAAGGFSLLTGRWPLAPGLRYEVGGAQQRLEGSCIRPPAFQERITHGSFLDIGIIHVSDLELPAAAGDQASHLLEDGSVVQVDSDNGVGRLRFGRLLFNTQNTVAGQLC